MKKYKDFFDFFDLDPKTDKKQIKIKTTKRLKSLHPDNSKNEEIEKFEDAKTARDILIDDEKRKKYKKVGHNKYVNQYLDNDLNGITFTGGSSLSQSNSKRGSLNNNKRSSDDLEDLIEFRDNNRTTDPTITAVNQTNKDEKSSSTDSAVEARKNWKDNDDKEDKAKKGMARLAVTILSIATSRKTKTIFLLGILLALYVTVYLVLGTIATVFAVLLSMGLFYVFATIF